MSDFNYGKTQLSRLNKTIVFLKKYYRQNGTILDLGPENPLSALIKNEGYEVINTPKGVDLDLDYSIVESNQFDIVTAFEIFEHMVSPFPLLKSIKANQLIASVPLKLWFSNTYWNYNDPFDRHYHEFEIKQFNMLLDKAGWQVLNSEKWVSRTYQIGIRPFLRRFTPRYYIVYAIRK